MVFWGMLRCLCCKQMWSGQWFDWAPEILCHLCGGPAVPEGNQIPILDAPDFGWGWEREQRLGS